MRESADLGGHDELAEQRGYLLDQAVGVGEGVGESPRPSGQGAESVIEDVLRPAELPEVLVAAHVIGFGVPGLLHFRTRCLKLAFVVGGEGVPAPFYLGCCWTGRHCGTEVCAGLSLGWAVRQER